MKPLASHLERAALWSLVIVLLASSLASIVGATSAASTSYRLIGYVDQPGGLGAPPVPAGVQVDLIARATGTVYTTTVTGTGGQFSFTSSGTGNALAPGYWAVWVPPQANLSLAHCGQCAALPADQNPTFAYYNATQLTNATYSISVPNVAILPYNATLNGTVFSGGAPDAGATVSVLDPVFNGLVLANATSNATGVYGPMHVPEGTWVVQTVHASGSTTYTNTANLTIATRATTIFNPVLKSFFLSGRILTTHGFVATSGNATLYDPTDHYIYTVATAPGGYYGFATYPKNFTSGTQPFDLIASVAGYETTWSVQNVSAAGALTHNPLVAPIASSETGVFQTSIDLSALNVTLGTGNVNVTTTATLGNGSVVPNLPNASVGQLWAQLGLDFNHSLIFPHADNRTVENWINASGPFFPAPQAGLTVNGTGFVAPTGPQLPASFSSTCTTSCGLSSNGGLRYSWSHSYALNGTVPVSATSYIVSFTYQHPTSPSDLYNYSITLPRNYVLSAGTIAPSHTLLVGVGPGGTWSKFTLVSKPSSNGASLARFTIVKLGTPTPVVSASVKNSAFSSANVLNTTQGNYTVVVGQGQNVTFSAINSTYPSGTNATSFTWVWGDATLPTTTNNTTANHTYAVATGRNYDNGTLTIHASGGTSNLTHFHVYVEAPVAPRANISSNATKNYSAGGTPYVMVNWSSTLYFNASKSTVTAPNVLSIALFNLTGPKGFNTSANFSVAKGSRFAANYTVPFTGVTGAGTYLRNGTTINTHHIRFKGWEYNLTLTVWSGTGQSANTTLVILVNDTKPPSASFQLDASNGKTVPSSGLIEGSNGTAEVRLNATAATNPNGSHVVKFVWRINNTASSWTNLTKNYTTYKPFPAFWLPSETTAYTIELNATDENNVSASSNQSLSVSINSTTRPILQASNLTGPTSLTAGTTYTFQLNITVGGGAKSAAKNLTVNFYLLGASGTGSKTYLSGSPGSVKFYNFTSKGVTGSTPNYTGLFPSLAFNKTVRAVITWSPSATGNFILYANATATNEFSGDLGTSNIASLAISVHPNPTTQLLEYGGIAAAVVLVIVGLIWWYRRRPSRRGGGTGKPSTGRGGLERGPKKAEDEDES